MVTVHTTIFGWECLVFVLFFVFFYYNQNAQVFLSVTAMLNLRFSKNSVTKTEKNCNIDTYFTLF